MTKFAPLLFVLIAICKSSAQSQTYKSQIGFITDNDAYLATKQDRYYTNGIEFYFFQALSKKTLLDTNYFFNKIWGVNVGQKIYNSRFKNSIIENVDRPFAAYLYGSAYLQWLLKNETIYKAELQLGTIGANALGKQTQEFIHNTFGFYKINGWQHQLNNAFGVNLNLNYHQLLYRTKSKRNDFSMPLQLNLGTTFTNFNTALLYRFGKINPLYQSVITKSNVSAGFKKSFKSYNEFFMFVKPSVSVILFDATIQGGLIVANKGPVSFNVKPIVFVQEFGAVYARNRYTFSLNYIFKTREVYSVVLPHQYGSINFGYSF